jgi:hypothetical protein
VNGQNVGPAEVENQEHFGGPTAEQTLANTGGFMGEAGGKFNWVFKKSGKGQEKVFQL